MLEQEFEIPEFPSGIPTSIGDEESGDGNQNICLTFCIFWWNSIRWVPWQSVTVCGQSPEEIMELVNSIFLKPLAAAGFQCQAQQGSCPAN